MSRNYHKKLRAIRKAEGLTQAAMASETGIALSSIRNYESGGSDVGLSIIERVLDTSRFQKYTMWLMTGQSAPDAGQVAPDLAHDGQDETTSSHSGRKTG